MTITVEIDVHSCSMRLIDVEAFLNREQLIREGKRVDRRAKVLEFGDDEVTEYAILSHRWTEQEVDYNEVVKLAKMPEEREVKFASAMAIERSSRAAGRQRRTGTSGCGWTLAVSTSEAAQSYQKPSIPCTGGTKTQGYVTRTFATSTPARPFPLRVIIEIGRGRMAGQSGSRGGGHSKR